MGSPSGTVGVGGSAASTSGAPDTCSRETGGGRAFEEEERGEEEEEEGILTRREGGRVKKRVALRGPRSRSSEELLTKKNPTVDQSPQLDSGLHSDV